MLSRQSLFALFPSLLSLVAVACGGGGGGGARDASKEHDGGVAGDGATTPRSAGSGVLRANVKVLGAAQAAQIVSRTTDTWVLGAPIGARVGDVLLLDSEAVRVTAVMDQPGGSRICGHDR